jgi:hypothetical protein
MSGLMGLVMKRLAYRLTVPIMLALVCASANAADKLPFTLTISGPESVTVGDEIKVNAVLKNVSNQAVGVTWGVRHIVLIHDEKGDTPRPKPGLWSWAGSSGHLSLAPGQTSSQYIVVSGERSEYELTKPGKYVVQLQRPMDDAGYPEGTVFESNKITIAIVPKSPGGPK